GGHAQAARLSWRAVGRGRSPVRPEAPRRAATLCPLPPRGAGRPQGAPCGVPVTGRRPPPGAEPAPPAADAARGRPHAASAGLPVATVASRPAGQGTQSRPGERERQVVGFARGGGLNLVG